MRAIFIIMFVLILTCGISFEIYTYREGYWRYNYDVEISEVTFCNGPEEFSNLPKEEIQNIRIENENFYVCGYLSTGVDIPVDLAISLRHESKDTPVCRNPTIDYYSTGYLYYQFPSSCLEKTGEYEVRMFFERDLLITKVFEISE